MARLICIGSSAGGLQALQVVLGALPSTSRIPVAVVQHREAGSDDTFRMVLQRCTERLVREVEDKDPFTQGTIFLAPPDYHLLVEDHCFSLSTEGPVSFARPSVDVLFQSAADVFGADVVAVVLTGANADGAAGMAYVKQRGGLTIVQDPKTAEVASMPRAAIQAARVDKVLPLDEIGPYLGRLG